MLAAGLFALTGFGTKVMPGANGAEAGFSGKALVVISDTSPGAGFADFAPPPKR